jgi:ParB family chromosome partitioning protein
VIYEADDEKMLEVALVENLQRNDLGPIEMAMALRHLIQEFGLTQDQVAEQIGCSRSSVTNALRLLELPSEIKEALAGGVISTGHARALLSLIDEPERMHEVFRRIVDEGLSVREAEALVRDTPQVQPGTEDEDGHGPEVAPAGDPHLDDVIRRLRDNLGTKVAVLPKSKGGGTIHIVYHDAEDLDRLLAMIAPRKPKSYIRLSDVQRQ